MAALVSCCALLLVAVSCTASQWSKPIAVADRRASTASEDWVGVGVCVCVGGGEWLITYILLGYKYTLREEDSIQCQILDIQNV
jgi:hypothetical protein